MALKEFKINAQSYIDRNDKDLARYLRELNRCEPISQKEEIRLIHIIKEGGKAAQRAKDQLIKANMRFVVSVVNTYSQCGVPMLDLIAEGNIGLLTAAERYDETRGCKFISFAVWWIRQNILAAINTQRGIVRMPQNRQRALSKYRAMQNKVQQNEHRNLSIAEFCEETGYDELVLHKVMEADGHAISTDAPLSEDDSYKTYGDTMASDMNVDDELKKESLHADLIRVMSKLLTEKELNALKMMYGIGCEQSNLEDIAAYLQKSRERTRQICLNSIDKIRNSSYSSYLAAYLAA